MYDIIVIGSATREVFLKSKASQLVKSEHFPTGQAQCFPLGSKIEVERPIFSSGGGGTNAAVTFARQGFETACIGIIGKDFNGRDILDELLKEHVDGRYFQQHDDDITAYSVILVGDDGERTILSYKGEGQHFDASQLPLNQLQSKWMYLDSLGGHWDVLEQSVIWAVKNNVKLATNPGGKELKHGLAKLTPLFQQFALVMMNQEEAAELTGIDYKDEQAIFKKMDEIVSGIFVMTKGPDGVVVSDGTTIYRAATPDSPVVERTGAGDAFNSGFVAEYMRSGDIAGAIQFGTANASSVVTQYGAKPGILKRGDWGPWKLVEVTKE